MLLTSIAKDKPIHNSTSQGTFAAFLLTKRLSPNT